MSRLKSGFLGLVLPKSWPVAYGGGSEEVVGPSVPGKQALAHSLVDLAVRGKWGQARKVMATREDRWPPARSILRCGRLAWSLFSKGNQSAGEVDEFHGNGPISRMTDLSICVVFASTGKISRHRYESRLTLDNLRYIVSYILD